MTRQFTVSRMRLIALLIVAAFSISAMAVATAYVAQPASAAKKKKAKKCKKGYKKVKGKCKKVKKKAVALKVNTVLLKLVTSNRGQVKLTGLVQTNVASRNKLAGEAVVTVAGGTQTLPLEFSLSGSPSTQFSKIVQTGFADTKGGTLVVTVGGVSSKPSTIK
jgi:hypothetical protein